MQHVKDYSVFQRNVASTLRLDQNRKPRQRSPTAAVYGSFGLTPVHLTRGNATKSKEGNQAYVRNAKDSSVVSSTQVRHRDKIGIAPSSLTRFTCQPLPPMFPPALGERHLA